MRNILLALVLLLPLQLFGNAAGDVGNTAIKDGAVKNLEVASDAAIAYSKLSLGSSILQSDMSPLVMRYVDVNLTAVQQASLNSAPVSVLAAPGVGYINVVHRAVCFVDFVAVRNECGSCVLSFRYTDASGVKATADVPNATVELNADTYYVAVGASGIPVPNAAIVVSEDAATTSGDSLINCRLYYNTVQVSDI